MAIKTTAARKTAPKKAAASAKKTAAYMFFNCDGEKSPKSKNVSYNNAVYRDLKTSRKALWDKIQEEIDAGNVHVEEANLEIAKNAVLEGNPTDASQYLQYGDVVSVECY